MNAFVGLGLFPYTRFGFSWVYCWRKKKPTHYGFLYILPMYCSFQGETGFIQGTSDTYILFYHFLYNYLWILNKNLRTQSYNLQKHRWLTSLTSLSLFVSEMLLIHPSNSFAFPQYLSSFQGWLPIYLIPPLLLAISITFAALLVLEFIRMWAKWGSESETFQYLCLCLPFSF